MSRSHRPSDFVDSVDTVPFDDFLPTQPPKDGEIKNQAITKPSSRPEDIAEQRRQLEQAGYKVGEHALAPVRRALKPLSRGGTDPQPQ